MIPIKVFICYACQDEDSARRLSEELRLAGLETWLDKERLLPGQLWEEEISRQIKICDFVLLLLSSTSVTKSGFFQKELRLALDAHACVPPGTIFILPVRLDECAVPPAIARLQHVDLFPDWRQGLTRVVRAVQAQLSRNAQCFCESLNGVPHQADLREKIADTCLKILSLVQVTGDVPHHLIKRCIGSLAEPRKAQVDLRYGEWCDVVAHQTLGFDLRVSDHLAIVDCNQRLKRDPAMDLCISTARFFLSAKPDGHVVIMAWGLQMCSDFLRLLETTYGRDLCAQSHLADVEVLTQNACKGKSYDLSVIYDSIVGLLAKSGSMPRNVCVIGCSTSRALLAVELIATFFHYERTFDRELSKRCQGTTCLGVCLYRFTDLEKIARRFDGGLKGLLKSVQSSHDRLVAITEDGTVETQHPRSYLQCILAREGGG